MTDIAVQIEGLTISYGGLLAVRGIDLAIPVGQHFTLLGASGCGKTTTLRAIAGLERPDRGRISLFGVTVFDSAAGIDLPAEARGVSMVFQNYAIWPHMSVFENVSYGLRIRKRPKAEIRQRTLDALALVGLADMADRPSGNLSGGQQQRVALARSFIFEPKILLFDEPLSNLDAKLRLQMRFELVELGRRLGLTSIYVTHDQEEALTMSDSIAVMNHGDLQQVADPFTLYHNPSNAFVADFIGRSNLLTGIVEFRDEGAAQIRLENSALLTCGISSQLNPNIGEAVCIAIKPVHVSLSAAQAGDTKPQATIVKRHFLGDVLEYEIDWSGIALNVKSLSTAFFAEGSYVQVSVPTGAAFIVQPLQA